MPNPHFSTNTRRRAMLAALAGAPLLASGASPAGAAPSAWVRANFYPALARYGVGSVAHPDGSRTSAALPRVTHAPPQAPEVVMLYGPFDPHVQLPIDRAIVRNGRVYDFQDWEPGANNTSAVVYRPRTAPGPAPTSRFQVIE